MREGLCRTYDPGHLSDSVATRYSDFSGFRAIFGQTWHQNPSRTTGLVLQCRLHPKSAPQTNSKAISWQFGILNPPPNEPLNDVGRYLITSTLCRSGNCSGWPGDLVPGLGVSIPCPGRAWTFNLPWKLVGVLPVPARIRGVIYLLFCVGFKHS